MLFEYDIVLIDETLKGVNMKLNLWREVLESKGHCLSRSKTKYIECNLSGYGVSNEIGGEVWRIG